MPTMKAAAVKAFGQPLVIEHVPIPVNFWSRQGVRRL
jgi:hypothetical protein